MIVWPNLLTINYTRPYIDTESFLKCTWLCGTRICICIPNAVVSTVQNSLPSEESLIREKNAARKFGIVDSLVRNHEQKMARGSISAGPNAWTFRRWYEWSCYSCKTCHVLVWGTSKAWAMVRVLHNLEGTCFSQPLLKSDENCMWWSAVMQKAFLIDVLCSLTITSSFAINYQRLSVLFKCVFDHLELSRPVLLTDWLPTDVNADLADLPVNTGHTISAHCILIFKPILHQNGTFPDMDALSKLYVLSPLYNP